MNARFIWDFGDGNVVDTNTNVIQHVYRDFGSFIPRIILKELGTTCSFPVTGLQPINLLGVTTKYTIDKQFFCDSGLVTILDSTTYNDAVTEYKWDFGDGTTFNAPNPGGHTYKNPGIYNVSLIVNTQAGCTDTLMKGPIKVVESPLIAVETDTVICVNDTLRHLGLFQRTDTSVVNWVWQFPNGNSSALQNPPVQRYPTAGSFVINAIATNSSGCADTVTKSLLVNPLPVITLAPTLTKFVGVPITLPATYSRNTVSYTWTPATSLSCTDCPQPVSETKFNRTYTVTVTDSNSCVNTDVVQVIVLCQGNKLFMPNTFSPNGDGTNDMFYPRGTGLDRVKSLRIFNRWGEVVFEQRDFPTNNASFGWNGMYKGKKALPDVYIYQAEIFCENSEIIRFEGNIALIQ
jgi:gliding motility-associated-like protein